MSTIPIAPITPECEFNPAGTISTSLDLTLKHNLLTFSLTLSKNIGPPLDTPPPMITFSGSNRVIAFAIPIPK